MDGLFFNYLDYGIILWQILEFYRITVFWLLFLERPKTMTWFSFENFQFWSSRENWLLRQHGRNFVAGADNTALCSGNLCKFVQLVGICPNICKLWNRNHIEISLQRYMQFSSPHQYISWTIIPKRTHSMIYFLQSVQIMESKRVGFFLRVRIPKLSGRSAANTVACKGHSPDTIVRLLVPVCLSVFLSLCISNAIGPIQ